MIPVIKIINRSPIQAIFNTSDPPEGLSRSRVSSAKTSGSKLMMILPWWLNPTIDNEVLRELEAQ